MLTMDAPSREICSIRRITTNTPLQALITLNDTVYIEAAQALARRMYQYGNRNDVDQKIAYGLHLTLGRPAKSNELKILAALYQDRLAFYKTDQKSAQSMSTNPLGPLPEGFQMDEVASLTNISNVILNLDEFLTKP